MDMEVVRRWRNEVPETLRTPFMLTEEQQERYYYDVICNRDSRTRYLGLWSDDSTNPAFLGYGGIENIEWENSRGEISVLIAPKYRGQSFGRVAVEQFLIEAFNFIGLNTVWGEVYRCGHYKFWERLIEKYQGFSVWLPEMKYFGGYYYDALYFTFFKGAFNEVYYSST